MGEVGEIPTLSRNGDLIYDFWIYDLRHDARKSQIVNRKSQVRLPALRFARIDAAGIHWSVARHLSWKKGGRAIYDFN